MNKTVFYSLLMVFLSVLAWYPLEKYFKNDSELDIGDPVDNSFSKDSELIDKPEHVDTNNIEPEIQDSLDRLLNTSTEGLEEVVTEDGVKVDLQGRFSTAPVATFDENGEIVIQDYIISPKKK